MIHAAYQMINYNAIPLRLVLCDVILDDTVTHEPKRLDRYFGICVYIMQTFWHFYFCPYIFAAVPFCRPSFPDDFTPPRRQAIFWTNADSIHWRIYAALGEGGGRGRGGGGGKYVLFIY